MAPGSKVNWAAATLAPGAQRQGLWLIVALYLALGLATSAVAPLGEAPDEVDHFLYVQYLARERAFPVMEPVFENNATMEANQPPLYYLLGALLTGRAAMDETADLPLNPCFSSQPDDPGRKNFYRHSAAEQFPWRGTFLVFHLVRAMSVLIGAGAVLLAYALGRQIAPDDRRVATAAAALLAFNPQFIYITASANNDVLAALLGAAIVVASVRVAQAPTPSSGRGVIVLAALIGLGALTKFGLLALWPLGFLAVLLPAWRQRRGVPWTGLVTVALLPLLVAGWWYWRAYSLYGDPLVWRVHLAAKGAYIARVGPLRPADLLEFARIHFQSYWGWFGWLNVKPPAWVYLLPVGMVLAAAAGGIKRILDFRFRIADWQSPGVVATLVAALAVVAMYAALFRYIQTINWSGYQGRLAYGVAAPVAALLAAGLAALAGSRLALAAGASLLPLAVAGLVLVIAPAYPRPQIYQPEAQAAVFAPVCARFDGGLQMEAHQAEGRIRPGETLAVTVYGYGLAASDGRQRLAVQLVGRDGSVAGRAETAVAWQAGQVVSATVHVPVAHDALPARAILQAGPLTPAGAWQPATSPGGRPLDLPVALAALTLAPAEPVVARPQHVVMADFGGQLALLGYDLLEGEPEVSLTLYWQAAVPMSHDYTVFVHLLDGEGRLVAQHDGQPQKGGYPTGIWEAGEVVADEVTLALRPGAPPGPYQAAVGVYLLATLERLPVELDGLARPDSQVLLLFEQE